MSEAPESPRADIEGRRPRIRRRLRTPLEARHWRRKVTGYALLAGAFILMVNALIGENGYLATLRAGSERDRLLIELARVRTENQRMKDDIARLSKDPAALEEAARRELNMIRRGETMVVLKDAPAKK